MKTETKLKKILSMEDSVKKRMKLFEFCCHVLPKCDLWKIANNEWKRLDNSR